MTLYIYLVKYRENEKIKYYTGQTNNPPRRLRQHRGEIHGGARCLKGREVLGMRVISWPETRRDALAFEKQFKKLSHASKAGWYEHCRDYEVKG